MTDRDRDNAWELNPVRNPPTLPAETTVGTPRAAVEQDHEHYSTAHDQDRNFAMTASAVRGESTVTNGMVLQRLPLHSPTTQASPTNSQDSGGCVRGMTIPFPYKLHRMLEQAEQLGFASIVSWVPIATRWQSASPSTTYGFKVHNPQLFVSNVMPRYFNQTKFRSFQRQLNIWGFCRVGRDQETKDEGGLAVAYNPTDLGNFYTHPYFVRGQPSLCKQMQRRVTTRKKTRQKNGGTSSTTADAGRKGEEDEIQQNSVPLFSPSPDGTPSKATTFTAKKSPSTIHGTFDTGAAADSMHGLDETLASSDDTIRNCETATDGDTATSNSPQVPPAVNLMANDLPQQPRQEHRQETPSTLLLSKQSRREQFSFPAVAADCNDGSCWPPRLHDRACSDDVITPPSSQPNSHPASMIEKKKIIGTQQNATAAAAATSTFSSDKNAKRKGLGEQQIDPTPQNTIPWKKKKKPNDRMIEAVSLLSPEYEDDLLSWLSTSDDHEALQELNNNELVLGKILTAEEEEASQSSNR